MVTAGRIAVPPARCSARERTLAAAMRSTSETTPQLESVSGPFRTTTQWTRLALINAATVSSDASAWQLTRPQLMTSATRSGAIVRMAGEAGTKTIPE